MSTSTGYAVVAGKRFSIRHASTHGVWVGYDGDDEQLAAEILEAGIASMAAEGENFPCGRSIYYRCHGAAV